MLAADFKRLMEENFDLLEATFLGLAFDGCGDLTLEIEVWEANYLYNSTIAVPDGKLKLVLKGLGHTHLERLSEHGGTDDLIHLMRHREAGGSEDGARTIESADFGDGISNGAQLDSRFEELRIQTGDFLLSATFLEGEIFPEG